ncbi:MAG: hypothetical protein HYV07_33250 [Deltaproteobacteria bacterium]|nr:hypothetical protein [Deltaproteobacteria bacterium]
MPILKLEIVGTVDAERRSRLAREVADAAGGVFEVPSGTAWVRIIVIDPVDYAENGPNPTVERPVFVTVLRATSPDPEVLSTQAEKLAAVVGQAVGRPVENVHVLFEPEGKGRVAFGGKLRR